MAAIPVNFMTFPEMPRIGIISCPVRYIRECILDYLRKCPEVEKCGHLFRFGPEIHFCVSEGQTAAATGNKIRIICPVFVAEMGARHSWIRRNFWLLWGAAFGLLHLLDTTDRLIEGSAASGAFSWGAGLLIVIISLMNYAIGIKHENALLACVREKCIEEMKAHAVKEAIENHKSN